LVLGLQKAAVKTHGSADKQQFYSGISTLYQTIKQDVIGKIKINLGSK
jgi:glycerol-3-phosphate acyltransferase PlsX